MEVTVDQAVNYILLDIARRIEKRKSLFSHLGIRDGVTALSLFNYALYLHFELDNYKIKGDYYLEKAFKKLNKGYVSPVLYREIAELGRFMEQASTLGLGVDDPNSALEDVDDLLYEVMKGEMEARNFDPVTGVLAYGYYFLSRVKSKPETIGIIQEINQFLLDIAHADKNGIYWKSQLKQDDSIYLGLSHGSANIILFMIYSDLLSGQHTRKDAIGQACNYLSNQQIDHPYLIFPIIVNEDINKYEVFPKHFCYGDYGTLYGLYRGFEYLDDEKGSMMAVSLIHKAHARGYEAPNLVAGSGLLYGHSGLAMLFRQFYEATGEESFGQMYEDRIAQVIGLYDPCDDYLGYRGYWNQTEKTTNYSFYEGMLGIALFLMSIENKQTRTLLEEFFYFKEIT